MSKRVRCMECNKWHLTDILLAGLTDNPWGNCGFIDAQWKKRKGLTYRICSDFEPLTEENKASIRRYVNQPHHLIDKYCPEWIKKWRLMVS